VKSLALALTLAASLPLAGRADPLRPLSPKDAALYVDAFKAVRAGDLAAASRDERRLGAPWLKGRLDYLRLTRPEHQAMAHELTLWLKRHADEPDADRVLALARRTAAAAGERAPAPQSLRARQDPKGRPSPAAAREAYFKGADLKRALALADAAGERWIAGLAAYRLNLFEAAEARFAALAADASAPAAARAGAAFWGARSAAAGGRPGEAEALLRLAAAAPLTFYGQIATRRLADRAEGPAAASVSLGTGSSARPAPATLSVLAAFVGRDQRARRAAAFAQIKDAADAQRELRAAIANARGRERALFVDLADRLGLGVAEPAATDLDPDDYPRPELAPLGGFTLDRALVYALVRHESGFNAAAASAAGALGLMQLTPSTAAIAAGLRPAELDPGLLLDAATNLRLGQDHVSRLLSLLGGDLLQTVLAYNAGAKAVTRAAAALPGADGLLLLESLPGAETREFAERVLATYWIYQRLMNQPSPTLDALAAGRPGLLAPAASGPDDRSEAAPPPAL
jgi:soluble lytic murein transglycosylase-like protein